MNFDEEIHIFKNLIHSEKIIIIKGNFKSTLFLEKSKILVTSGENGTNLRKFKKWNLLKCFEEIKCNVENNGIANIGNDRIVVLSGTKAFIILPYKMEIIKKITVFKTCDLIQDIKGKNIFFIASHHQLFTYNKKDLKFGEISITSPYYLKYKKILKINNEIYLILPLGYFSIYIYKY